MSYRLNTFPARSNYWAFPCDYVIYARMSSSSADRKVKHKVEEKVMSYPEFIRCKAPITGSDLDEVQARLRIVFPPVARELYLRYNGGHPVPSYFPMDGEYYGVHQFFPIKDGESPFTLEATYERVSDALPRNFIP